MSSTTPTEMGPSQGAPEQLTSGDIGADEFSVDRTSSELVNVWKLGGIAQRTRFRFIEDLRGKRAQIGKIIALLISTLAYPVSALEINDERHWVMIYDQPIKSVLSDLSAAFGVPVLFDEKLKGRIRNVTGSFTAAELLTRIGSESGTIWFNDGNGIHVSASSETKSFVIDTVKVSPERLQRSMMQLGYYDERFPMAIDDRTGMGLVSGPPRYLELLRNSYGMLASRKGVPNRPVQRRISIVRGGSVRMWQGMVATPATPQTGEIIRDPDVSAQRRDGADAEPNVDEADSQ